MHHASRRASRRSAHFSASMLMNKVFLRYANVNAFHLHISSEISPHSSIIQHKNTAFSQKILFSARYFLAVDATKPSNFTYSGFADFVITHRLV